MSKHVGSEFDGTVTGVTSFGLFVELDESKVSGLVHISQLSNDYYHFDPVRHLLKGERSGVQFRLGDHVRVQVLRASLEDRKIDFRLVPPGATAKPPVTTPTRAYDYAAAGERYSLPKPRGAGATPAPTRDNAGRSAPRKGSKSNASRGAKASIKPQTTKPKAAKRPGKPKGKR
jgi:ribonuclease R